MSSKLVQKLKAFPVNEVRNTYLSGGFKALEKRYDVSRGIEGKEARSELFQWLGISPSLKNPPASWETIISSLNPGQLKSLIHSRVGHAFQPWLTKHFNLPRISSKQFKVYLTRIVSADELHHLLQAERLTRQNLTSEQRRAALVSGFERAYGSSNPAVIPALQQKRLNAYMTNRHTGALFRVFNQLNVLGLTPLDNVEELTKKEGILSLNTGLRVRHSCGYEFTTHSWNGAGFQSCPKCIQSTYRSNREQSWKDLFQSRQLDVISNNRTIIPPYELDLYLPNSGIGIEFNGYYWHSSKFHPSDYHQKKSQACLEKGIKLYHIWEDIPDELVKAILFPQERTSIYSRHLTLCVNTPQAISFIDKYHRHHYSSFAHLTLSLETSDEVISALSFSHRSNLIINERYCVNPRYRVLGGFMRLLKAGVSMLQSQYSGLTEIITYCDRDLSPDPFITVYARNGFTFIGDVGPQMMYYVENTLNTFHGLLPGKTIHFRQEFQKRKLLNLFPESDPTFSEADIAAEHGIYQVYNSGTWKYRLSLV